MIRVYTKDVVSPFSRFTHLGRAAVLFTVFGCDGTEQTLVETRSGADAGKTQGNDGAISVPPISTTFQIQLTGSLDDSVDADIYDIDLNVNSETEYAGLRAAGRSVACYFSAGTLETFRGDRDAIPASAIGSPHPDYPDERWLDVRSADVLTMMLARIQLARDKGCDTVHPANVVVFESDSGFTITRAENAAYALALADAAHRRGLSVAWSDEPDVFPDLDSAFDWGIAIQCIEFGSCARWKPFRDQGKPVYVVEIGSAAASATVCPAARTFGLPAIIKDRNYTSFRVACPR